MRTRTDPLVWIAIVILWIISALRGVSTNDHEERIRAIERQLTTQPAKP